MSPHALTAGLLLVASSLVCAQGAVWTDSFTSGVAPTPVQSAAWGAFRASLVPARYESVTISGTFASPGISCTDIAATQAIAALLVSGGPGLVSCQGNDWSLCNRYNGELWLNPPSSCSPSNCPNPGYIIRPGITNPNWGGCNTATCPPPTQTQRLEFFPLGPSCSISSPASGATVMGTVPVVFDADEAMMISLNITFDWSNDAGITWNPATAAASSPFSNPAFGVPVPQPGARFDWDSILDGVAFVMVEPVMFRITVDNGSLQNTCAVDMTVDNVRPLPTCRIDAPAGTPGRDMPFAFDALSISSPFVDLLFEWSTDGGASFLPASAASSSTIPNPATGVIVGSRTFIWDSRADGVGLAVLQPGVLMQLTVNDGVSFLPGICVTGPFDVDNTQICGSICGDCNLNSAGPDIVDALAAAQISAGLLVPGATQAACCDVDVSGAVDIIDSLYIAQTAAGLSVTIMCI